MEFADVVYCWIYGEHPCVKQYFVTHHVPLCKERCYSYQFIQTSIALFKKFSNHKGRIIIVSCCGLKPHGVLEMDNVYIIDQNLIIPHCYVPAMNNMVVECFLHNIPNITSPFIYMNDDYNVMNYFDMNTFYDNQKIAIYRNSVTMNEFILRNNNTVWDRMMVHNAKLSHNYFKRDIDVMRMMQHMPYVLVPEVMRIVCETFRQEIHTMCVKHHARTETDVIMVFLHQEWWLSHKPEKTHEVKCDGSSKPLSYMFVEMTKNKLDSIVYAITFRTIDFLTLSESHLGSDVVYNLICNKMKQILTS